MPPRDETEAAVSSPMTEPATRSLAHGAVGAGRVSTYAVLGAVAGSVPVPWVPDLLTRRVRGALTTDIAARHGLSITSEARDVLAEPAGTEGPRGMGKQAMRFFVRRVLGRFGPLAVVPTVRSAIETFVLGHLFSRYLGASRTERAVRIDVEEARTVRQAIDKAVGLALSPEMRSQIDVAPRPPEELRDGLTQMIDGVLMTFASAPEWVLHRLEAAFDEAIARGR